MDYIQALVYDSDPDAQGIADELQVTGDLNLV
jgi:hypothetical protein